MRRAPYHKPVPGSPSAESRLGVYVDDVYRVTDDERISTDRAFLLFACEVGRQFEELVLFGRTVASGAPADYVLPSHAELAALPYYADLKQVRSLLRTTAATAAGMWRGLDRVDAVWVFGPHPLGFLLIALALIRRKRVVLGVRQDTVEYARHRLGPRRRLSAHLVAVRALDWLHRVAARWLPCTIVGEAIASRYRHRASRCLVMTVSLVPAEMLAEPRPLRADQNPVRLLTVGRLESEKNPLLLIDALAELNQRRPGRFRLTWIGRGDLEAEVRARAHQLGIDGLLELRGYMRFGESLLELYRQADAFVHVSHTEGVPQVLIEAMACATPIVATAVGGVSHLLAEGRAGLLVSPNDLQGLVLAIERLADDGGLRLKLTQCGLDLVAGLTVESQSARVARFIAA